MTAEDAPLAEALIAAGVGDLYSVACESTEPMVDQWCRLIGILRKAGYEITKTSDASSAPDLTYSVAHLEAEARVILARLAPPGTKVTPALIAEVRAEILRLAHRELTATFKLDPQTAAMFSALLVKAIDLKVKP